MDRNLDRGLDKRVETQKPKDSSVENPKVLKVKEDTAKKLSENFKKNK